MIFICMLMLIDSIPPVVGDGEDNVSDGDSNDIIFLLMCCDSIQPVEGDGEDNVSDGDSNDIYLSVDVL